MRAVTGGCALPRTKPACCRESQLRIHIGATSVKALRAPPSQAARPRQGLRAHQCRPCHTPRYHSDTAVALLLANRSSAARNAATAAASAAGIFGRRSRLATPPPAPRPPSGPGSAALPACAACSAAGARRHSRRSAPAQPRAGAGPTSGFSPSLENEGTRSGAPGRASSTSPPPPAHAPALGERAARHADAASSPPPYKRAAGVSAGADKPQQARLLWQRCVRTEASGLQGLQRAERRDRKPNRREAGRASMQAAALQVRGGGGARTWPARTLRLPSGRAGRAGRGLDSSTRAERLGRKRLRGLQGGAHRAHGLRSSDSGLCVTHAPAPSLHPISQYLLHAMHTTHANCFWGDVQHARRAEHAPNLYVA